MEITTSWKQ